MVYPFSYTVVMFLDFDESTHTNEYRLESGMSFAASYTDAMEILENYYGTDLISVKHLELYEEGNVIIVPHDFIKTYEESEWGDFSTPCDAHGNQEVKNIE